MKNKVLFCFLTLVIILGSLLHSPVAIAQTESTPVGPKELIHLREENKKIFDLGNGLYRLVSAVGPIHYKDNYSDPSETWKDINLTLIGTTLTQAPYILTINKANSITVRDKATGKEVTVELLSIGPHSVGEEALGPALGYEIVPQNAGVKFRWTVGKSSKVDSAQFKITGDTSLVSFSGTSSSIEKVQARLEVTKIGDIYTERILNREDLDYAIDPTINVGVGASTDDAGGRFGFVYYDVAWTVNPAGAMRDYYQHYSGMRFLNITIESGSTITNAYLNLTCYHDEGLTGTNCNTTITAWDKDDTTAFTTSSTNFTERWNARTTAKVRWWQIPTWSVGTVYSSPNFSNVTQEVIDRPGWTSGNSMIIFWDDRLNESKRVDGNLRYAYSWDSDSAKAPVLVIDYLPPVPPTVTSSNATDETAVSAKVYGNITSHGGLTATHVGFEWGTATGVYTDNWTDTYSTDLFDYTITGLTHNTTYFWRAFATSTQGTGYSSERDFTTLIGLPTVDSSAATDIAEEGAVLHGDITDLDGAPHATVRGLEWGTSTGVYTSNWTESGTFGTGVFEHEFTGMPSDTTIYWRAFATAVGGTGYSTELSFDTLQHYPLAPTNFTAEQTALGTVTLNWTMGVYANTTVIRAKAGTAPTSRTDGWEVYNSTASNTTVSLTLGEMDEYGFSAWSHNDRGWSIDYVTTGIGGESMLLIGLLILGLVLFVASFRWKDMLLSYAAALTWMAIGFWWIIGDVTFLNLEASWTPILIVVPFILAFTVLLRLMNTEITHEASGKGGSQSWTEWGPAPSVKQSDRRLDYQKMLRRRLR